MGVCNETDVQKAQWRSAVARDAATLANVANQWEGLSRPILIESVQSVLVGRPLSRKNGRWGGGESTPTGSVTVDTGCPLLRYG